MEASRFICQELAKLNSSVRLAWAGRKRKDSHELNAGDFCIVQLYPMRVIGSLEVPQILSELWDIADRTNVYGQLERQGITRGPIFNKKGGFARDWNFTSDVPVYVAKVADYGLSPESVMTGGLRKLIERWQISMKIRNAQSVAAAGKVLKDKVDAISHQVTDKLWYEASKSDSGGLRTSTREERVAVQAGIQKKRANFADYYDSNKVFR